ncbi:DUF1553 domain-containing protein [Planctomyces sp. SH-PL62]|uniref:DUF1553 domain-containing protein n=1 Tax=Planctomyces sp. SH-PL62 TaxID=1636152 RepID=UPI00078D5ABB|nr:DUF1553 domain-containing protein [Planctomyces sp. SH-PL62]AMV39190.1 Planctomycete cytochrome C [Planctomyces sp. SH-PL62]
MPPYRSFVAAFCLVVVLAAPAGKAEPPSVDFSRDVLPILSENCLLCHGPDAAARKADLRLDVSESALRKEEPIIVPGDPEESEFLRRLTTDDADEKMPPAKSGKTLTPEQVATLTKWVEEGARWGKHWAFDAPRRPEPPVVHRPEWVRNPIDRFVLARLEREGIAPAPEADPATLIRRLSLDLTGLPPTLAEIEAFASDPAADAYEKLVDRLLASPRYGEAMASDWLDAARYADTNGYQNDFARTMWPWRDWVVAAFNRNQPFDQFAIEQIAGDRLPNPSLAQKIATGFNRNNRTVTEAGSIDEEYRIENAVDRVETTSTVFLGLTMGCARCHDHKYDPVTQKEFYEFLGFFNNLNEKGVYTETRGNVPPLIAAPSPEQQAQMKGLEAAIAEAAEVARKAEAGLDAKQAAWEETARGEAVPSEPIDWSLRFPLSGDLAGDAPAGATASGSFQGEGEPIWVDGPISRGLTLDGRPESYVEAGPGLPLEPTSPFTFAMWVRPLGDGACLSKMDEQAAHRGYDVCVLEGKITVHLIHSWPGDAIKVKTKEPLPRAPWSHVVVGYDGSGKAQGVKILVDGKAAAIEVEADALKNTLATDQPLRIGRRTTGLPFRGELADVRFYNRDLSADEVRRLFERPIVEIARLSDADRTPIRREVLARYFRESVDRELPPLAARLARLQGEKAEAEKAIPTVMIMEDAAEPRPLHLLKRGQYDQPETSESLTAGVPACLPPLPSGVAPDRLALARWLVAPENPLTARVTVNRIWQRHFGEGLVKSSENFGLQSEPPTHPMLLDWLATELVRGGWDLKHLHRLIVTSAAYRQSSRVPAELVQRDPENRLLARGPRFRLGAEAVRDNVLAISGLLASRFGGPSDKPYQPAGLWEELAGGAGEGPYIQDKGEGLYRRSLYIYRKRTVPHPVMATFDAPSREICQVKRDRTNTPLQALELLNDVVYVEAARSLATLMLEKGGSTPEDRIAYAFRRATAREPNQNERRVLLAGLEHYLEAFRAEPEAAKALIGQGERPIPANLEPVELAAYSATAGVILNLDETITLE